MVAFFCSTPYQLLIAIQIKRAFFEHKVADVFVLNHFANSEELVKNLDAQKIFRNVKSVDALEFTKSISQKSRKRHFLKLYSYYNYKKIAKKYFQIINQQYDDVFFSYADVIIQLGLKQILSVNRKVKVHLFEDGVGGYLNFGTNTSKKKKWFNRITGSFHLDKYADLYAFLPDLMYATNLPKVRIPQINQDDLQFVEQLNAIFGYNHTEINQKIILLQQPLDFKPNLNQIQFNAFNAIYAFNPVIKIHPRSNSTLYSNFQTLQKSDVPWEIICMNSDVENKVLVSFYSTAIITNKVIFDKEPSLIFLYDLDVFRQNHQISDELRLFFEKFSQLYLHSKRIYFPKTIAEFQIILESIDC